MILVILPPLSPLTSADSSAAVISTLRTFTASAIEIASIERSLIGNPKPYKKQKGKWRCQNLIVAKFQLFFDRRVSIPTKIAMLPLLPDAT
jgi:hypothetical protein